MSVQTTVSTLPKPTTKGKQEVLYVCLLLKCSKLMVKVIRGPEACY